MSSRHFFFGFHDLATTLPQPQPPPTITTSTTIQKKKMDDLTCSICLDSFYDPRITPCSHVFCSSCLSSLPSPFCPLCRCPLPLSSFFPLAWDVSKELLKKKEKEEVVLCECCDDDDGTSRKVATFWCEDCHKVKDCPEYFCDSCEKVEHQTKISRKHHRIPLTEKPLLAPLCEQHHQELLFFCNTEEKSLCYRCLEDHLGHNVISIEKQAEKNREVLRDLIEKRSSLGREKVPFFEEKRRDIVEKEIRGLRKKLEEKEKEREELEGTIVVVRERENEHGERVNVLLGEVERMNTFDLVGKKGGEKVVRMRKRIREGMGELLEKKEKEGFKRLRAMEEKMEEEVEMGNKELTERWKDKRKVYDMERKEYEKVHKDSSLFHNHCINVALITSTSLQKDNRESPLDMIDFTTYPNFPMNRYQKLSDLRTTYAQQYGESESERNNPWRIRFWYWEKRENHTKRVCYPFRERDYDSPIGILWAMYKFNKSLRDIQYFPIFVEISKNQLPPFFRPIDQTQTFILIFFKYFDEKTQQIRHVGNSVVRSSLQVIDLFPIARNLAGMAPEENIRMFEEKSPLQIFYFGERGQNLGLLDAGLGNGDVIVFEKEFAIANRQLLGGVFDFYERKVEEKKKKFGLDWFK